MSSAYITERRFYDKLEELERQRDQMHDYNTNQFFQIKLMIVGVAVLAGINVANILVHLLSI